MINSTQDASYMRSSNTIGNINDPSIFYLFDIVHLHEEEHFAFKSQSCNHS